jgi:hypothetical protein
VRQPRDEMGGWVLMRNRISGYTVLLLSLATICAATQTDFNVNVLHVKLWAAVVASVLVVLGVGPRIKKAKLGF